MTGLAISGGSLGHHLSIHRRGCGGGRHRNPVFHHQCRLAPGHPPRQDPPDSFATKQDVAMLRRAERVAEFTVGDLRSLEDLVPGTENAIELVWPVGKRYVGRAPLAPKKPQKGRPGPLVLGNRVERLVVEQSKKLGHSRRLRAGERVGHARDLCPPDFLRRRLELPREPLPTHGELLVRPRHLHRLLLAVQPAVPNNPRRHRKPAAILVAHGNAHGPLGPTRLRPEPLEHAARPRDLDERTDAVIARADDRLKLAAGLDGIVLGGHHERPLHGIAVGRRVDHSQRRFRANIRHASLAGNREYRSVDAHRQRRRDLTLSGLWIGRGVTADNRLPEFPRLGIGRLGRWLWPRTTGSGRSLRLPRRAERPRQRRRRRVVKRTAIDFGRLHKGVDRQRARCGPGLAVERRGGEREFDGRRRPAAVVLHVGRHGLPVTSLDRGFDIGVARRDGPLVAPRLAAWIGDVGHHLVGEHGQRRLRHALVGQGGKSNRERAIGTGHLGAPGDLPSLVAERQPRKVPAAPKRQSHPPLDPPCHLRAGHGEPGVGRRLARHGHGLAEPHRVLGHRKVHLKLWPLVFLDAHGHAAIEALRLGEQHPLARQRAGRNRKRAVKGAELIGGVLGLGNLAAIGIAKRDRGRALGDGVIVAAIVIERAGDPLVEDGLARAVDAAVGDEHDRCAAALLILPPDVQRIGRHAVEFPGDRRRRDEEQFAPLFSVEFVATVGVGRGRAPLDEPGRIHPLLADKCLHRRPGHRFARRDVNHVARASRSPPVGRRHDRQSRHPHERGLHDVVLVTETWIVAGDHPIRPRFERLWLKYRDGKIMVPRPVIGSSR